jgi:hypothetical protein
VLPMLRCPFSLMITFQNQNLRLGDEPDGGRSPAADSRMKRPYLESRYNLFRCNGIQL